MQVAEPGVSQRATPPAPRLPIRLRYLPGLDGLRAVAVMSVLFYHHDKREAWPQAGFLGVEVFFVISGYLITSLLFAEWRNTGRIDLRAFYVRRARRLLPALFLVMAATAVFVLVFLPDEVTRMRRDVLPAIFYVTNWWQIFSKQGYFEAAGREPVLGHLWSLAVEEQFYLLWPLMFAGILLLFRKLKVGIQHVVWVVLGGALASTLLMSVMFRAMYDPKGNIADVINRVYLGTDTRASGLLLGAALALVWSPWRLTKRTGRGAAPMLDLLGIGGLALIGYCMFHYSEFNFSLYQWGGFFWTSVGSVAVIMACAHPASVFFGRFVMGSPPMRWLGERSYGIYLWHWPIFMVTRPGIGGDLDWSPGGVFVLRLALTLAAAELSFRFVERPIRRGAIGKYLAQLRAARGAQKRTLAGNTALAFGAAALAVVLVAAGLLTGKPAPASPDLVPEAAARTVTLPTTTTVAPPPGSPTTTPPAPPPATVTAVGDSVMQGAAGTLENSIAGMRVDTEVSRQFGTVYDIIVGLQGSGQLGEAVVIHTGTNGLVDEGLLRDLLTRLRDRKRVVMINLFVPRGWEAPNNDVISRVSKEFTNVRMMDWNKMVREHPDYVVEDGFHLRTPGQIAYVQEIIRLLYGP